MALLEASVGACHSEFYSWQTPTGEQNWGGAELGKEQNWGHSILGSAQTQILDFRVFCARSGASVVGPITASTGSGSAPGHRTDWLGFRRALEQTHATHDSAAKMSIELGSGTALTAVIVTKPFPLLTPERLMKFAFV